MVRKIVSHIVALFIGVVALIFMPKLAQLLSVPVYMIEPMRLITIIALVHFRYSYALLLAALLPIFAFYIHGHPPIDKAAIIAFELVVNVLLFLFLKRHIAKDFFSMAIAIISSKVICYLLYIPFFSKEFMQDELDINFLIAQLCLTLVLAGYAQAIQYFKQARKV